MRMIDADKVDFSEVFIGNSDFARDAREAAYNLLSEQPTIDGLVSGVKLANIACLQIRYKQATEILEYYDKQPYFFAKDASADIAFKKAIAALKASNERTEMEENKRELEKDLIEIMSAIKSNEERDNTFTATVLQNAYDRLIAYRDVKRELENLKKCYLGIDEADIQEIIDLLK